MLLRTAVLMAALIASVVVLSMAPLRIDGTYPNSAQALLSSDAHHVTFFHLLYLLQLR
jgi:Spy/CpxP family protein refolding chaperone